MKGSFRGLGLAAAGLIAAATAGLSATVVSAPDAPIKAAPPRTAADSRLRRLIMDGLGRPVHYASYPRKAGWTNASYRRAAVKKRNQRRHRRACRG